MQALIAPLKELAEYDEIRKVTRQGKGTVALSGCVDSQKLHMIYGLSDGLKYKVIVTYSDLKAKEIYEVSGEGPDLFPGGYPRQSAGTGADQDPAQSRGG